MLNNLEGNYEIKCVGFTNIRHLGLPKRAGVTKETCVGVFYGIFVWVDTEG